MGSHWHLFGRLGRRGLCALAVTASVVVCASSATSAGPGPRSWSGALALDSENSLSSVACPSGSECVAVDNRGQEITFDPEGGGVTVGPTPPIDSGKEINGLACAPASNQCTAVDSQGRAVTFDATTGAILTGPASIDGSARLTAVSCPSASECVAVDEDSARVEFDPANLSAPAPSVHAAYEQPLLAVACVSTSECVATADNGHAVTFDPLVNGPSAAAPHVDIANDNLYGVQCLSVSECVAVDGDGNEVTFTPDQASPTVDTTTQVDADNDGNPLLSVACPTSSQCTAVGYYGDQVSFDPANGAVLSAAGAIDTNRLRSVACPSAAQCVAVDDAGNEFATTTALTVSLAGSGSGSVRGGGISCPGRCAAGIDYGATVALTASPASGSSFAGWSGAGCSGTGSCAVPMTSAQAVTAAFTANPASPAATEAPRRRAAPAAARVRNVKLRGDAVSEIIECTASPSGTCKLSITLTVAETIKHGKVVAFGASKGSKATTRTVTLGSASVTVRVGHPASAKVSLNATGKRLLAARHRLAVALRTTIVDGAVAGKRTLTFR